jgi:hypothetical protein
VGDTLISNSVTADKNLWGGAAQVGYNFYINPTWFINLGYTYAQTGKSRFENSANAAVLNGAGVPGPNTVTISRTVSLAVQNVMFSVNKVF